MFVFKVALYKLMSSLKPSLFGRRAPDPTEQLLNAQQFTEGCTAENELLQKKLVALSKLSPGLPGSSEFRPLVFRLA